MVPKSALNNGQWAVVRALHEGPKTREQLVTFASGSDIDALLDTYVKPVDHTLEKWRLTDDGEAAWAAVEAAVLDAADGGIDSDTDLWFPNKGVLDPDWL